MSIKDKVIVITGAASGMGLATAQYFAKQGARLSLADIQPGPLSALEAELKISGTQVLTRVVNVSSRSAVESWIADTVAQFGKLDGCANIAGTIGKQHGAASVTEIDDDDWDFVFSVNTKGLLHCLRAQIPHMNEGGSIVNAASILGLVGSKNSLPYVASKHAVVGMTRAVAKEVGDRNIRVNCFCPGPIETPMLQKATENRGAEADWSFLALGRPANSREVPPLIEFLLSPASSFITGVAMPIDGGWYC